MWVGSAEAAARPATASCEGALASLAAQYAPGTVAYLTHLLQLDAANAGVPMGSLNRAFAKQRVTADSELTRVERRFVMRRAASAHPEPGMRPGLRAEHSSRPPTLYRTETGWTTWPILVTIVQLASSFP